MASTTNSTSQSINVIAAIQEVKVLELLTHTNICACENFIRSTNATIATLPLTNTMDASRNSKVLLHKNSRKQKCLISKIGRHIHICTGFFHI
jgi:hypothetical protein